MNSQFTSLDAVCSTPTVSNEPVLSYAPGSPERISIKTRLNEMSHQRIDLPLIIGGQEVHTGKLQPSVMPHRHGHILADAHLAGHSEIESAIAASLEARSVWSATPWEERAAVFLRAAEFASVHYRDVLNAATMLGQSKTVREAEIDSAAELTDYWRYNAAFLAQLYARQPVSPQGTWNRSDYRPLEGFVYAVTPFNFTAIAGNLPCAPALAGNTVLWKPAGTARYSAHFVMEILRKAGLPPGVINLVYGDSSEIADHVFAHPLLAGVHFTGSTSVFNSIMRRLGEGKYRNYPRLVGETGGKNFILAHASADLDALSTAILRGGFEYQGQKCSAASRVYVPKSRWKSLRDRLVAAADAISVGDVADFRNFMGAVIDSASWSKLSEAQDLARHDPAYAILCGGKANKKEGWFIAPTLVESTDPGARLMKEELFGPIIAIYVYDDAAFSDVIQLIDSSSDYGLTGSIFASDVSAIRAALTGLRYAAGNFYINDKPTGAVVGQQPFGGGRLSGTNDKAGSVWNLMRWMSPRTVKENFLPPKDYRYPFMSET